MKITKMEKQKLEKQIKAKRLSLNEFVYEYAKDHIYVSKPMLTGLYYTQQQNLQSHTRDIKRTHTRAIRRKIANVFVVYFSLGLAEKYGKNTVKVDREKLKKFTPEELAKFSIHNHREKKVKKQITKNHRERENKTILEERIDLKDKIDKLEQTVNIKKQQIQTKGFVSTFISDLEERNRINPHKKPIIANIK